MKKYYKATKAGKNPVKCSIKKVSTKKVSTKSKTTKDKVSIKKDTKKIPAKNESATDWKKLRKMSEKEIIKAAKSDPDAHILSESELKKFKRVSSPKKVNVKKIRVHLGFSQSKFADYFGVSIRTIQEWEQERREPTTTAKNFLKVIELEPKAVQRALAARHHH